jgi:hypothetical protein
MKPLQIIGLFLFLMGALLMLLWTYTVPHGMSYADPDYVPWVSLIATSLLLLLGGGAIVLLTDTP